MIFVMLISRGHLAKQLKHVLQIQNVFDERIFSINPNWVSLMTCVGERSMANLRGQELLHKPHW